MAKHYRVTLRDAVEAHEQALRFGGAPGIRSWDLIESAIARPYSGYHRPISQKAAALTESLASNHGFVDGNKRTALLTVALLISRSGYRIKGQHKNINAEIEELILDVVAHRLSFADIVDWFGNRLERI